MKWDDIKETFFGIVFLVAIIAFATYSCDSNNESPLGPETTTVTFVNGMIEETVTITCDQEYSMNAPTKAGYYFKGYYDSETDGTCYIGSNGKSIGLWTTMHPTKLYAQYGSISELKWTSDVECADEACQFGFYDVSADYKLPDEFKNAIKANPNKNLKVTLRFSAKQVPGTIGSPHRMDITLQDGTDKGAMKFGSYEIMAEKEYNSYTFDYTATASYFNKGMIHIVFDLGYANTNMYLRNISIDVSFAD